MSVIQIEYVNGRCTTDILNCSAAEVAGAISHTNVEWFSFETRDNGELIVRAEQVVFIRCRPLAEGEDMETWSELQRAFRGAEGGGR